MAEPRKGSMEESWLKALAAVCRGLHQNGDRHSKRSPQEVGDLVLQLIPARKQGKIEEYATLAALSCFG